MMMKRSCSSPAQRWPRRLTWPLLCGAALAALCAGCQAPAQRGTGSIDAARAETRDDIVQIVRYWKAVPWLFDSEGRPVGFSVPIYFVSGQTERGAFVPGKILIWMYVLENQPGGPPKRELVRGWEFNEQESTLYRVTRRTIQGYGYMFPLIWGPNVEVFGKTIEIVFGYERRQGGLLTDPGKRLKVPEDRGQWPATQPSPPGANAGAARDLVEQPTTAAPVRGIAS